MPDEPVSLRDINWRDALPFINLFRGFRVAVHPSKLVLALVALGCLWCGGLVLDAIWNHKYEVTPQERIELFGAVPQRQIPLPMDATLRSDMALAFNQLDTAAPDLHLKDHYGVFDTFFTFEVMQANKVLMFRGDPFESIWEFVAVGPLWLWSNHWLFAVLYTAWFLLIWSLFGGAIARIAAVHVARDEKISVRSALSFSAAKILSFIFAPIIPVLIIFGIGLVIAVVSTILFHIPYVGPPVAGLVYCLALLGGFVITLVLLGTLGGYNLMFPTIAVEGSDSFDAISRSFSYVFARPWRMLWYTIVSVVYGAICYLFVRFFIWMILAATWFFMTWFFPPKGQPAHWFPVMFPQPSDPLQPLPYSPGYDRLKGSEQVAAGLMVWWNYLLIGLVGAFAISFYFSANSIIYYLMRREVDATELDDVYVEETDDEIEEPAAAPKAAVIKETVTVRVYETEEGAPAPESPAAPSAGPADSVPPAPPPPGSSA